MAKRLPTVGRMVPLLQCKDASAALEWYRDALGATIINCVKSPVNGEPRVLHAEFRLGEEVFHLVDWFPQWCPKPTDPLTLSGTSVEFYLYLEGEPESADILFKHAVKRGATQLYPPADEFWGARVAKIRDPWGHDWFLSAKLQDPQRIAVAEKRFREEVLVRRTDGGDNDAKDIQSVEDSQSQQGAEQQKGVEEGVQKLQEPEQTAPEQSPEQQPEQQ